MSKPDPTELLPCPFCGGAATYDYDDDGWNWIVCRQCGVSTNASTHCGEDCRPKLAEVWNRRAVPALVQPEAFIAALRAYADNEYCLGIRMAGWQDECLGWEHKLKAGKFGRAEMEAHKKMNKHLGAHFGIHEAIKRALAASPSASQPEPSDAQAMAFHRALTDGDIGSDELEDIKRGLRAAFAASASLTPPAPRYYCNKCGSFPDAVHHNRPDGSECPYIARESAAPAPSPEPREPTARLSESQIRSLMQVAHKWAGPDESDSRSDELEMALRAVRVPAAPPSLPETVTDAQWMAEAERLVQEATNAACRCGMWEDEDETPYKTVYERSLATRAALLAHIGKRPAMSEDAKDAARYRLIRQYGLSIYCDVFNDEDAINLGSVEANAQRLDAAIDRALSTAPAQPTGKTTDADGVSMDRHQGISGQTPMPTGDKP